MALYPRPLPRTDAAYASTDMSVASAPEIRAGRKPMRGAPHATSEAPPIGTAARRLGDRLQKFVLKRLPPKRSSPFRQTLARDSCDSQV